MASLTRIQRELLEHPVFDAIRYHERLTLAVTSDPFPREFNPHFDDGVEYRAVSASTGTSCATGKRMMALFAFYDGIEKGLITPDTTVVEASSGNTGPEMQRVAMQLGIRFRLFLRSTMPIPKLDRARSLEDDRVKIALGGAADARELGKQPNHYNPDQYSGDGWNDVAQYTFLAPQVFAGNEDAAAIFVVGGSWGTARGFRRFALERGLRTQVRAVVAAGQQDLSGGKNLQQTETDILFNVFSEFPKDTISQAPRSHSTFLSWASWPHVVSRRLCLQFMLGQSFGGTVFAAFKWVEDQKRAGTLNEHRGPDDKIVILTFGMDDYQGYTPIYYGELDDATIKGSRLLPPLEELLKFDRKF